MFVEYKKHLVNGVIQDPDWVINGGHFMDENNTFVGVVLDESERMYYIPDTVTVLTREEVKQRIIALGLNKKLGNPTNPHSKLVEMTDEELESLIDSL